MVRFAWGLRVYYEDTDLAGIVYYANHLRYMERARTEWLRSLGCEQDALLAEIGAVFVVVRANLEYKLPARFNDVLVLTVGIASMGRASVVVRQDVYRGADGTPVGALERDFARYFPKESGGADASVSRHLVCSGEIRIACVRADTLYPCPIPEPIYAELSREH